MYLIHFFNSPHYCRYFMQLGGLHVPGNSYNQGSKLSLVCLAFKETKLHLHNIRITTKTKYKSHLSRSLKTIASDRPSVSDHPVWESIRWACVRKIVVKSLKNPKELDQPLLPHRLMWEKLGWGQMSPFIEEDSGHWHFLCWKKSEKKGRNPQQENHSLHLDYQSKQAPLDGSCPPQWSSLLSQRGQSDQLSDRSQCRYSPEPSGSFCQKILLGNFLMFFSRKFLSHCAGLSGAGCSDD